MQPTHAAQALGGRLLGGADKVLGFRRDAATPLQAAAAEAAAARLRARVCVGGSVVAVDAASAVAEVCGPAVPLETRFSGCDEGGTLNECAASIEGTGEYTDDDVVNATELHWPVHVEQACVQ